MIRTKQDAVNMETNLILMNDNLKYFDEQSFDNRIRKSWENLRFETMMKHLKTLPINILSTLESGLPLNALALAGYETIYDINNFTNEELMHIDGIGLKSAESISHAVSVIKRSVLKDIVPKINPDRLSDASEYALFMSGTPLENNVEEMKQLVTVLNPSVGSVLSEQMYMLEPKRFKQTIQEVYLRRNRTDVLEELPELEILEEWVPFGQKEFEMYREAVMAGHLMMMRRAAWLGKHPNQSPKLDRLIELCNHAKENGHKVIVFSFFKDVLKTVHEHLQDRTFEIISGDVPNSRRQEIIDDFSQGEAGSVLISQITAGGVGLNIQAANVVVLCEPQWKPSTENQAISRAYRMGQARKVLVYRLLTENSIDESMLDILDYKSEIFDLYARESEISDVNIDERDMPEDENVTNQVLQMEKERLKRDVS